MKTFAGIALSLLLFFTAWSTQAATLTVTPSATQVKAGDLVTVRIVANSEGVSINNAEAVLRFPSEILSVMSVSKSGSIFSLWVEEPTFSNSDGTVSYNGGVPNPGYTGSAGTILTVTFTAKSTGTATLSLSDAAVRANDGSGTDVLRGTTGTQITVATPQAAPVGPPPVREESKSADVISDIAISSPTHPDQDSWYATRDPLLQWDTEAALEAVQLIVDRSPTTNPSVTYQPAIFEKTVTGLEDGVWYFRIRAREDGAWSTVSSYRLNIDTTEPMLEDLALSYDASARAIMIAAHAADEGSGIAGYEISIDGNEPEVISGDAFIDGAYAYPYTKAGKHEVALLVRDRAGNSAQMIDTVMVPESLMDTEVFAVGALSFSLTHLLIGMGLISLVSLAVAAASLFGLVRLHTRPRSATLSRDVHRGFALYKKELEKNLRLLEKARETRNLTSEEAKLHKRMLENLSDLERYISGRIEETE